MNNDNIIAKVFGIVNKNYEICPNLLAKYFISVYNLFIMDFSQPFFYFGGYRLGTKTKKVQA